MLDCSIARLLDCSIARMLGCSDARMLGCSIARMLDCRRGLSTPRLLLPRAKIVPMTTNTLESSAAISPDALPEAWRAAVRDAAQLSALRGLAAHIEDRLAQHVTIYPRQPFRALADLSPSDVRVVILGQDPYHGPGQAQGLAFSVPDDCKRPPSLRNIFKELARECPAAAPREENDLSDWAHQGVLLLNTSLTVEDGAAGSHAKKGWEIITDALIAAVARDTRPKVFMLWGAHAQAKRHLLPPDNGHLVLMANHPSPLSAGRPPVPFIGCGHFRKANEWLASMGQSEVQWNTR
jgi:uracil-DNA glycosylase